MKDEVNFETALLTWSVRFRRHIPSFILDPSAFILLILCGLLFFKGIASREMWASHEARSAQNAQDILDDGNWGLPRLYDGQVELQKPPGFYWLVALVGWLLAGVDEWAVRLPAAIAGTLTVLLVWQHLRGRVRPVAAFVAATVLAGAVHFTGTARIGRIDVPLACVVTAIMLSARSALGERSGVSRPMISSVGIGVLAGIALLLKGPIGVALPAAALSALVLIERISIRPSIRPAMVAGVVALAIAAPWFLWANAETDGELYRVFILHHHFHRAFGGSESLAGHPWWYYLPRFAADFLPWTPLLLAALALRQWRGDSDARFGLIWLLAMIALLSLSRFKRADYLLPSYAGAAIFLGCAMERWYLSRTRRVQARAAVGFAIILLSLPVGWIVFDRLVTSQEEAARDQRPFARQIREIAPAPQTVILFRVESHLLVYHLGRPVHTLVEWADLQAAIREPGAHFVVTRAEFLDEVRAQVAVPLTVVVHSGDSAASRPSHPLVLLRIGNEPWPTPPRD